MKRILVSVLFVIAMSVGFVGCSDTTKVQQKTSVQTDKGKTEVTKTEEVTKSGEEPPPVKP
jgi:ABC-type Fe3+-citrate transport system substrate-binding protein